MPTVPARKVQQFVQEPLLLNLAVQDVERVVCFEELGELSAQGQSAARRRTRAPPVDCYQIERRIQTSEKAYQRPILRKGIDEPAVYYLQSRDGGAVVPAIAGVVLLTSDSPTEFAPQGANPVDVLATLPVEEDTLRVHRGGSRKPDGD